MDSSVSPKDEIWFLRVCHHISNAVYHILSVNYVHTKYTTNTTMRSQHIFHNLYPYEHWVTVERYWPSVSKVSQDCVCVYVRVCVCGVCVCVCVTGWPVYRAVLVRNTLLQPQKEGPHPIDGADGNGPIFSPSVNFSYFPINQPKVLVVRERYHVVTNVNLR